MKRLLQLALLFIGLTWCVPAFAAWTWKQSRCTGSTTTDAFSVTSGSITGLTAITAGSSLIGVVITDAGSTFAISSINGETWTHCTAGTAACGQNSTVHGVDASYVLSATGGETSFLFTINNTSSWNACIIEAKSSLTPAFDNNNGATSASSATTPAVTITGSNDFGVAAMATAATFSTVSGSAWTVSGCSNTCFPNGDGAAWEINTASGTGATFTSANTEASFTLFLKETGAPVTANRLPALGVGIVLIGFFSGILLGIYDTGRKHVFQGSIGADSYNDTRLLGVYNHDTDSQSPLYTAVLEDGVWVVPTVQMGTPARTPLKSLVN